MDARLITLGGAGLAGLVVGGALWALSGGHAQGEALEALDARITKISTRERPHLNRSSDALNQVLAAPLFVAALEPTTPVTEIQVQLFGVAKSPVRTAALISVGGAPAEWLSLGENRSGVTLRSVSGSGATIATILGDREIMLGSRAAGANMSAEVGPPAGFKSPPPPASAPGMPQ